MSGGNLVELFLRVEPPCEILRHGLRIEFSLVCRQCLPGAPSSTIGIRKADISVYLPYYSLFTFYHLRVLFAVVRLFLNLSHIL